MTQYASSFESCWSPPSQNPFQVQYLYPSQAPPPPQQQIIHHHEENNTIDDTFNLKLDKNAYTIALVVLFVFILILLIIIMQMNAKISSMNTCLQMILFNSKSIKRI